MDALLSAVASELVGRFISFLLSRCQTDAAPDDAARLRRLLLRASAVVEEADSRLVTTPAMLLQIQSLRWAMYRGYYVLDTLIVDGAAVKARRWLPASPPGLQDMRVVVESLEATLRNMKESLELLMRCPPLPRRPYGTYLFMERCMFGRHVEKELVVSFLLQPRSPAVPVEVLPIIGPYDVGKRTLVHHACAEDRVRGHLSQILQLDGDALAADDHQLHSHLAPSAGKPTLIIVEYNGEAVDDAAWGRLCDAVRRAGVEAKIIVVGRTEQVARLGTTAPLRLRGLRREEYWYFFRVLAFGSADPADHPALLPMARRMAANVRRSFMAANIFTRLLRANLSAAFWLGVLRILTESVPEHVAAFGAHPWELIGQCRPYHIHNYNGGPVFVCYDQHKAPAAPTPRPGCRMEDILDGSMKADGPGGEVQVLIWQSPVPPHYDYMLRCRLLEEKASLPQPVPQDSIKQVKRKRGSGTQHAASTSSAASFSSS